MNVIIDGVSYVKAKEQPKEILMVPREAGRLIQVIQKEGFDYAFYSYSAFDHGANRILCPRFHQLLAEYLEARREFTKFLQAQGIDV